MLNLENEVVHEERYGEFTVLQTVNSKIDGSVDYEMKHEESCTK
jgi:hypothetical protein